jgi:hypothetical protein
MIPLTVDLTVKEMRAINFAAKFPKTFAKWNTDSHPFNTNRLDLVKNYNKAMGKIVAATEDRLKTERAIEIISGDQT